MYCRGALRAQSLAAPVILSVLNVHVILLFETNKPYDDDDVFMMCVLSHLNKDYLLTYLPSTPRFRGSMSQIIFLNNLACIQYLVLASSYIPLC